MVIDIKKKYLFLVAGIIVILSAAFIVFNSIRNENYEKNVKVCQENIYKLYFMSTLAASDIQTTWQEYIFDDKKYMDKKTGKFYSSPYDLPADADEQYCYDFNDAIVAKVSFLQNRKAFVTMDSLYTATKNLLKELTPAPKNIKICMRTLMNSFILQKQCIIVLFYPKETYNLTRLLLMSFIQSTQNNHLK